MVAFALERERRGKRKSDLIPLTLHQEEPVGLGFGHGVAGNSWVSLRKELALQRNYKKFTSPFPGLNSVCVQTLVKLF